MPNGCQHWLRLWSDCSDRIRSLRLCVFSAPFACVRGGTGPKHSQQQARFYLGCSSRSRTVAQMLRRRSLAARSSEARENRASSNGKHWRDRVIGRGAQQSDSSKRSRRSRGPLWGDHEREWPEAGRQRDGRLTGAVGGGAGGTRQGGCRDASHNRSQEVPKRTYERAAPHGQPPLATTACESPPHRLMPGRHHS